MKFRRVHGQILPLTYLEACSIQDLGNFGSEASDIRSLAAPQGFPERPERKEDPKLKVFRQFESADGELEARESILCLTSEGGLHFFVVIGHHSS